MLKGWPQAMAKRSAGAFERAARDFYPTPPEAVVPLLPHLKRGTRFCEPCAGNGALISHLAHAGHVCVAAFDIEPQADGIERADASFLNQADLGGASAIITNPPWERAVLHQLVSRFLMIGVPSWLLFDADWSHTRQAVDLLRHCSDIVAVGRVKWIAESSTAGKDNAAWHRFAPDARGIRFWPRQP
jgi:hypothetical protein